MVTAFADYLKAPEIEDGLTFSDYQGQAGYEFKVAVIDDFKVKRVHFILLNLEGSLVESGDAIQQADGLDWAYISKVNNLDYNGGIVQIKAYDYPDNEIIAEAQLDKEVS